MNKIKRPRKKIQQKKERKMWVLQSHQCQLPKRRKRNQQFHHLPNQLSLPQLHLPNQLLQPQLLQPQLLPRRSTMLRRKRKRRRRRLTLNRRR
jgi:hypothetical protein